MDRLKWMLVLMLGVVCGQLTAAKKQETFVVGTTSGYAPFVSLNEKGEYEGFDIDVAERLAEKLGKPLEVKDFGSMPGLMMAVKQKKIDALIWAVSITKQRQEKYTMIHYQGETEKEIPFLFWGEIPEGIHQIEDLGAPGRHVCVEAGTSNEGILQNYPGIEIKYADKILDVIMDLRYQKCFTVTLDPSLVDGVLKKYPEVKVLNLPLPADQQIHGVGICLNKKNTRLSQEVLKAVEELKSEGTIASLEKKWGLAGA